jgi:hypothetical protein
MTTFDDRLAARLRELDAAIPEPAPLALARATSPVAPSRLGRGSRARVKLVLLAAAAALAIGTGVASGTLPIFEARPEPELEWALHQMLTAEDCVSPGQAEGRIQAIYAELGYEGWSVLRRTTVRDDDCVTASIDSESHAVWLIPGVSGSEHEIIEAVRAELLERCLGRDAAFELVRSALDSVGSEDVSIGYTNDPGTVGNGRQSTRVRQYVADGCYVLLGGVRWFDAEGRSTIYLWGE